MECEIPSPHTGEEPFKKDTGGHPGLSPRTVSGEG
jgi:hypothetical protein